MSTSIYKLAFKAEAFPGLEEFLPRNNFVGVMLFHRVLRQSFEAAGLLAGECLVTGELSACFGTVAVSNFLAGAELLKEELFKVGLLGQTRIAWQDEAGLWRFVYPPTIHGESAAEVFNAADCEEALQRFQG